MQVISRLEFLSVTQALGASSGGSPGRLGGTVQEQTRQSLSHLTKMPPVNPLSTKMVLCANFQVPVYYDLCE